MKLLIFFLFIVTIIRQSDAQDKINTAKKIKSVSLSDTIVAAAIDRPGDFYALTRTGQIQHFDKDGKLMLLFKSEKVPTLFDPRDGARLFLYYRGDQHYEFRNPSFEPMASYAIDPAFAIQPWLICTSGEYKLWILDQVDNSLKKIDVRASEVEVEVLIDSALIQDARAFTTMREYQSFVFLLNPLKGIYVFNSLGKHLKTIPVPGISSFNFLGEELYYLKDGKLQFFNLFSAETRHLQIDRSYTNALLTDERMILFTPEKIDIYPFRP